MDTAARLLVVLFGLSVAELAVFYVPQLWQQRRLWASLVLIVSAFAVGMVVVRSAWPVAVLLGAAYLYRVFNLLRVVENRMQEEYLRRVSRRTSWWLNGFVWLWVLLPQYVAHHYVSLWVLACLQLVVALFLFVSTVFNIRRSTYRPPKEHIAQRDLPTVTVAIPARNETTDLIECLQSVVASTYVKLEVIVLDDCSQAPTSDIIKQFAQNGVRFIAGDPPRPSWLAKNQAYDALADAATGDYVLFCGADVRFGPDTITNLIEYTVLNKLAMVSVLPQRLHPRRVHLIQPMRYWWELTPPRFWMRQPPSLSTCWLIDHDILNRLGRFDAVEHRVRPETYFARETYKQGRYAFIRSSSALAVGSAKNMYDQFQTVIRVRYPDVHKRPELVYLTTLFEAALFALPFAQIVFGLASGNYLLAGLSFVVTLLLVSIQILINISTRLIPPLLSYIIFPLMIVSELYLINESMRRYEFSEVTWRGRNICLPVMHHTYGRTT